MQDASRKPNHKLYGGIAASIALHVIIAVALFARLPVHDQTAPKEETVSVEIVPPPEEKKADEKPPEKPKPQQQALNLKMPEQKPEEEKKPVPPPEPPKQEAEKAGAEKAAAKGAEEAKEKAAEEAAAEKEKQAKEQEAAKQEPPAPKPEDKPKPEEKPKGEAKASPPPPPAAEKQAEKQAPPPPPPAADKQQPPPPAEKKAEPPQAASEEQKQAEARAIKALGDVTRFGEKQTDPRKSPDGDAAEDSSKDAEAADQQPGGQQASDEKASDQQAVGPQAGSEAQAADAAQGGQDGATGQPNGLDAPLHGPGGAPLPPQITLPGVDLAANGSEKTGLPPTAGGGNGEIVPALPTARANGKPASKPGTAAAGGLKEAKTLFSNNDGHDAEAVVAMDGVPRSSRVAQLCASELKMQLRHARHWPDLLPSPGLKEGNVLDVPSAAFHDGAQGGWFDVGYRCEVDPDATKIVSFAIKVGDAIPRSQWKSRRLPDL